MGDPKEKEDCYICDRTTDLDDFCAGCQEWICKECDEARPTEAHDPNDHRHYAGD